MKRSTFRLSALLIGLVHCAPAAEPVCATRTVLGSMIPASAEDCGSFFVAATNGVNTIDPPTALECANRAIASQRPFVVRELGIVGSASCSGEGMCPLVRGAVGAWLGASTNGRYVVTQVLDTADPSQPSARLSAFSRGCTPANGAALRLVSASTRTLSILCDASAGSLEMESLSPQSVCAPSAR